MNYISLKTDTLNNEISESATWMPNPDGFEGELSVSNFKADFRADKVANTLATLYGLKHTLHGYKKITYNRVDISKFADLFDRRMTLKVGVVNTHEAIAAMVEQFGIELEVNDFELRDIDLNTDITFPLIALPTSKVYFSGVTISISNVISNDLAYDFTTVASETTLDFTYDSINAELYSSFIVLDGWDDLLDKVSLIGLPTLLPNLAGLLSVTTGEMWEYDIPSKYSLLNCEFVSNDNHVISLLLSGDSELSGLLVLTYNTLWANRLEGHSTPLIKLPLTYDIANLATELTVPITTTYSAEQYSNTINLMDSITILSQITEINYIEALPLLTELLDQKTLETWTTIVNSPYTLTGSTFVSNMDEVLIINLPAGLALKGSLVLNYSGSQYKSIYPSIKNIIVPIIKAPISYDISALTVDVSMDDLITSDAALHYSRLLNLFGMHYTFRDFIGADVTGILPMLAGALKDITGDNWEYNIPGPFSLLNSTFISNENGIFTIALSADSTLTGTLALNYTAPNTQPLMEIN